MSAPSCASVESTYSRLLKPNAARDGFTLIELLASVVVVSMLLAILLPAVQVTREATRRSECQNNLRQIGLAAHSFHDIYRHFPTNGWGYGWIGDPLRGVGNQQPGGWIFQLLPYLGAGDLYDLGRAGQDHAAALGQLSESGLAVMRCPTRPGGRLAAQSQAFIYFNAAARPLVARTDYAINEGDYISNTGIGPSTLAAGDVPDFGWTDTSRVTGVSWQRGGATMSGITAGMTQTYFAGEKCVARLGYNTASDIGYDQSMYSGVDLDIARWTIEPPLADGEPRSNWVRRFGSSHSAGANFLFCDGAVQLVAYSVHPSVHRVRGVRRAN